MTKVDTAQKLVTHNMGTCLSCHRQEGSLAGLRYMPLLMRANL